MIDLGDEIKITVKYQGQEYNLSEPTMEQVESIQGKDLGVKEIFKFLSGLGMPEEVLSKMGASKCEKLIKGLLGSLTEKK